MDLISRIKPVILHSGDRAENPYSGCGDRSRERQSGKVVVLALSFPIPDWSRLTANRVANRGNKKKTPIGLSVSVFDIAVVLAMRPCWATVDTESLRTTGRLCRIIVNS